MVSSIMYLFGAFCSKEMKITNKFYYHKIILDEESNNDLVNEPPLKKQKKNFS